MSGEETRILFSVIPSFIAVLYGLIFIFPKSMSVYYRLPVMAIVSNLAGQLSYLVVLWAGSTYNSGFSIGVLGQYGAEMFMVATNIGSVSSFIESDVPNLKKYRRISILAPVVVVLSVVACVLGWAFGDDQEAWQPYLFSTIIFYIPGTALTAWATYQTFKMALLPDLENGFIASMRPYNLVMTLLLILFNFEGGARYFVVNSDIDNVLMLVLYIVLAGCMVAVLPLLERGRKKCLTL